MLTRIFNHDKIKTWCDRPDDFTQRIDRNVKQTVKEEDLLIHLGDVGIGKYEGYMQMVLEWPGRKILVRGNHDGHGCQWYMERGFHFACDAMIYRGVWLTHKPWLGELPEGTSVNVHGHLHNIWDGFYPEDPEAQNDEFVVAAQTGRLMRPWHRLFAVEYTNYFPIDFDKFVAKPDKYQARGPNEATKAKMKAKDDLRKPLQETEKAPWIQCPLCFESWGEHYCLKPNSPGHYGIGPI